MPYFENDNVIATMAILTGTLPLQITSTSLVTNLNADLLDGQHGDYYLQAANLIGSLSPVVFNDTVHGNRQGGTLHAYATSIAGGFLSPNDKIKIDSITPGANVNQNAYSYITDGTNLAQATTFTDTFKIRSNDINYLTVEVANADPTHGDNVLLSINTDKLLSDVQSSININYTTISTNVLATKNSYYFADTTAGEFSIIPFSNPSPGDYFYVLDFKNNFTTNKITLISNKYEGTTGVYYLTIPNKEYKIIYISSAFGWKII